LLSLLALRDIVSALVGTVSPILSNWEELDHTGGSAERTPRSGPNVSKPHKEENETNSVGKDAWQQYQYVKENQHAERGEGY